MFLATRCPNCETIFRLQETQLALRGGLVRCGHCQAVFNAHDSLIHHEDGAAPIASGPLLETPGTPEQAVVAAPPPEIDAPRAPEQSTLSRPTPNFRSGEWDMWAPRPDARINPALLHNVETVAQQQLVPGSLQPEATPEPAGDAVHEPAQPAPAQSGTMPAPAEFGDMREPSFTARPNAQVHAEPHEPDSTSSPAPTDEPTLASTLATSWSTDPEPHFGTPAPQAEATETTTPEPSGAHLSPAPHHTDAPFAPDLATASTSGFVVTREERAREPRHTVWRVSGMLVALLLAVVLIAQLAWWRREAVMVSWPGSQPLFTKVCQQFGCQISPPRDIDGLQVEASDLRQIDGAHHLELRVPLRNHDNVALAYPAMELTLLDDKNNIAIRRVLRPQDYLRPGASISAGLPPHTTQAMVVRLDTGNAVASNFRVQIFYP
jgi:predicted Zn finger-like uncharacterized protein